MEQQNNAIEVNLTNGETQKSRVVSGDNVYTDVVPAIIDEKTFEECNHIMAEHHHRQHDNYTEKPYVLSGKLYCGYCNSLMTAESGTSHTG